MKSNVEDIEEEKVGQDSNLETSSEGM